MMLFLGLIFSNNKKTIGYMSILLDFERDEQLLELN